MEGGRGTANLARSERLCKEKDAVEGHQHHFNSNSFCVGNQLS